jgi:hypothetical protein
MAAVQIDLGQESLSWQGNTLTKYCIEKPAKVRTDADR